MLTYETTHVILNTTKNIRFKINSTKVLITKRIENQKKEGLYSETSRISLKELFDS